MSNAVVDYGKTHRENVRVSGLKFAPFNPVTRTSDKALKSLVDQIVSAGNKILCPIHVSSDGRVIDGHRRVHAAIRLGINEVPAIVYDEVQSSQARFGELFLIFNVATRKVSCQEQLWVALQGGPASVKIAQARNDVQDMLGVDTAVANLFLAKGASLQIINNAHTAYNVCKNAGLVTPTGRREFQQAVVDWQLRKHTQQDTKIYFSLYNREVSSPTRRKRFHFSPERFFNTVKKNEELDLSLPAIRHT